MAIPKGTTRYTPQFLGESSIADAIDAVGSVKRTRNVRALAIGEIAIARSVFKETIPYSRVFISDGLGFQGREYTLPNPYTSPREYLLHVGEQGYTGMSKVQQDKETLIHELTHVWQGEHSRWAWTFVFKSAWHQAKGSAYDYDKKNYKQWNDYNPEQQAQIVQDWFAEGRRGDGDQEDEYDPRYLFIVQNIRREMIPIKIRSLEQVSLSHKVAHNEVMPPLTDHYLIDILKSRYNASNVVGFGGRVRELEKIFTKVQPLQAKSLLTRLEFRRANDKVSEYFFDHLSTATRLNLLGILRSRAR